MNRNKALRAEERGQGLRQTFLAKSSVSSLLA